MKRDEIAIGEALPDDGETAGVDVTHLLGHDPERAAFNAYRVAFRKNAAEPNLRNAVALVRAWNSFADVMRLDHV